ncbi:rhomboid family intramembrane serine protease [bacterium]|nr:rhomboid family intramembrane serine protease [bacterium]
MMSEPALPAWARDDAFPIRPDTSKFGVVDHSRISRSFESLDELKDHLEIGKGRLNWIWTPESDRLVAPEEIPKLAGSLKKRCLIFAAEDEGYARRTTPLTGIAVLYGLFCFLMGISPFGFPGIQFLVLTIFGFLYFTARPWWEARKARAAAMRLTRDQISDQVPEARFELWMENQRTPFSVLFLVLVVLVGGAQFATPGLGISEAGLVKPRYAAGENWRLFTAAFLHGNLIHFILNVSALWYLGRRVETLARWPHLAAAFFLSIIGAGWATVSWLPNQTSVGVSGVVCGLLGFLLVFETLHRPLVPRSARRRLAGILVSLIVIGTLGFKFVDNAAHLGGS